MGVIDTLWHDLRYAWRIQRQNPGFTLIAVLSLALGIGANTVVFSVVRGVLLRPLPYPEPDRLVQVVRRVEQSPVSIPEYEFWKQHADVFASAAAHRGVSDQSLAVGARNEWIKVMSVSAGFFRTLGVAPALGREFEAEETRPGGPQAVVLSDGAWQRILAGERGGDRGALGRTVTLNDAAYTVVGVLPPGFWFPQAADAFIPLRPAGAAADTGTNTSMIARLKPNVRLQQADAELASLTESYRQATTALLSRDYRGLMPVSYQAWLSGDVRVNLLFLFGAVAALLLIACSNLASLLLARLASRKKEIAMRLALGSSRSRLLTQFLIENLLLSATGGLAGLLAAAWLLDGLLGLIPFQLPASTPVRVDLPVLVFTLAVAVATGLMFSAAPLLASWRSDVNEALKSGGRGVSGGRQRARGFVVAAEVALSVTLLVTAALLIQSLYRLHREQLGFDAQGLITFSTPSTAERRGNAAELRRFDAALLERLRLLPGVRSVAAVNTLPLRGPNNFPAQRAGRPDQSIGGMEIRVISPAYFETMGIPMRRGRPILASDRGGTPMVIVVNETVARRWWPKADPIGDRIVIGRFGNRVFPEIADRESPREVVGVVADTKSVFVKEPPRPTVYIAAEQAAWMTQGMNWVVRATSSPVLAAQLRQTIAEIDPRQRVDRLETMDAIVASATADSRFNAWLFGIFAGLALVLAVIGVYGMLSFSVARRANEIGIRMALGANRTRVLKMILKQGIGVVAGGLAAGMGAAFVLTRALSTLLFGVRPADPFSYLAVCIVLLCAGLIGSCIPARRATRVDPMVALRSE